LDGWSARHKASACLPRVIVTMEKFVEWTVLAGETKVLGENLFRLHFVHYKSHLQDQGANPGRRGGKPATNRFSYGTAITSIIINYFILYFVCNFFFCLLMLTL
jgi:hypothetical protein